VLLAGMARFLEEGGGTPLAALPLLGAAERQQLREWGGTTTSYPREGTLFELFAEQAARTPEAVALVVGAAALTYGGLLYRARHLARALRGLGVGPEVPVGLCLERSPGLVVATLGVLAAGGAYVPLDPTAPAERLAWLLAEVQAPVVVGTAPFLSRLAAPGREQVVIDESGRVVGEAAGGVSFPSLRADATVGSENVAYVMFTSGSTGEPKGVAAVHRAVVRLVTGTSYARFGPQEVFLQLAPMSFDAATFEIWGALLHGARLVVPPPGVLSTNDLGSLLAREGVTTLWLTAGLFHEMVEQNLAGLAPVSQLLAGGDTLSPAHVERVLRGLPGTRLINGYGPTEGTTFTACAALEASGKEARATASTAPMAPIVPIGRPVANTYVAVLDGEDRPVPVGVVGELVVGGDGLARGYRGRPGLTAERFRPDPGEEREGGARVYRTGDRVRWLNDGQLEFLGRLDHQVKLRGFRIEPGEIEAALVAHPRVAQAAVLVRVDQAGEKRLVAWVVGTAGEVGEDLRGYLWARLPEYMVPSAITELPALPLNANGKVDRRALTELEIQAAAGGAAVHVPPRTPVEELVAAIWSEVLAVERVGAEDDFFALGGHSLLATRAISRVRQAFGVELPLHSLFDAATVATFAREVESALAGPRPGRPVPPLLPVGRDRDLPLSFAQERLWLIDRLQPGSAAYNIPVALRLQGGLDLAALEATFVELLRRHESLRTTFRVVGGEPAQEIHPATPRIVPRVDLAGLPGERREGEARRLARTEARRPFDLAAGPLLRLTLLHLSGNPGEHLVLLTQHHIVSDGWSMGVLIRELGALYSAFRSGLPSPLPEPGLQYADFAVWQRDWLAGGELAAQLSYWRGRLAGAPELLDLPLDRPRTADAAGAASRAGRLQRQLPAELLRGLRQVGRREPGRESTLFMVLLAAWSAFLARI
ncbi:MAG TPA: amino acid adenylation domain-containing protein, partial [Thermoanaerobaculia bacterium]|nr:amino acid adenylation domain-containing protein [Thermoanaerobaculia bacterium]